MSPRLNQRRNDSGTPLAITMRSAAERLAKPLSNLDALIPDAGIEAVEGLRAAAREVRGLRVQMISSTARGGGGAEILTNLVPLLNEAGVPTPWDVIPRDPALHAATKSRHNTVHR